MQRRTLFAFGTAAVTVFASLFAIDSLVTEAAPVPKPEPRKLHPDVTRLAKLVPPPATPKGAVSEKDWAAAEKALGTKLPDDYKDLVDTFGEGGFAANFLFLYSPSHSLLGNRLVGVNDDLREAYRRDAKDGRDTRGVTVWPDADGLLFVGHAVIGADLFYRPKGAPGEWKIGLFSWRSDPQIEGCGVTLGELLLGLAEGNSTCPVAKFKEFVPPWGFVPRDFKAK